MTGTIEMMQRQKHYLAMVVLAVLFASNDACVEPRLFVDGESTFVHVDTEFDLDISMNDEIIEVMGYSITVGFDAAYLQLAAVEEGPLPRSCGFETFFRWLNEGCSCDSVVINGSILGGTAVGPGALIRLRFRATQEGVTHVDIARSDIRDGDNNKLPHSRKPGTVTIEPPIATETTSWGGIKSLFR